MAVEITICDKCYKEIAQDLSRYPEKIRKVFCNCGERKVT